MMLRQKDNVVRDYINHEDLLQKLGYPRRKDKGLSVISIRTNKREKILSLASANHWSISWLQKQLDEHFGFGRKDSSKGLKVNELKK